MVNQIKIKILGIEYVIKQSFRALMLFEEITGKNSFAANDTVKDITTLLYCFLKGANRETFKYTYDELLDIIDDHPEVFQDFADYLRSLNPKEKGSNITPPKKKRK
jgi:hypothetical protein